MSILAASVIVAEALSEIGKLGAGQTPGGSDGELVLSKLNQLLDLWNADQRAVYGSVFTTYAFTPSLSPHTIGPTGATFTVTSRPVSIESAQRVRGGIGTPIRIRTAQWWAVQSQKALTGEPSDLYYDQAWPNGQLFFWPVPTTADVLELQSRVLLASLAFGDTFSLPPGYQTAITLTLAEDIAPSFGATVHPRTAMNAENARALIFGNNVLSPHIATHDAGMPGGGGSYFDYQTGQIL